MKIKELRQKNTAELEKLIGEKTSRIRQLRFAAGADSKAKNVKEALQSRRDIARIHTLMHERKLAEVAPAAKADTQ